VQSNPVCVPVEADVFTEIPDVFNDDAEWLAAATAYLGLFDLGDHADEIIAKASLVRKKAVPIEEVYEDCGEDVSAIELPAESTTESYFECDGVELAISTTVCVSVLCTRKPVSKIVNRS
jgi:hypothetical protein